MSERQLIANSAEVVKTSFKTVLRDPQIAVYPLLAFAFISITYPLISSSIFSRWYNDIFSVAGQAAPHKVAAIIGLVGFSAFYAAFVTAIFTCAISAAVLAKLDNKPTKPLNGLAQVLSHFLRVSRFAILSVFLFPVGVYAQRRKLPGGIVGVVGSSITLHMANLAPAILTSHKPYGATVREAINTLGKSWKEGLVLKIGMYVLIFIAFVLPKLLQHHFSPSASDIGWLVSLEFAASGYVVFKVINAIFMTVLYHQAQAD